jgi:hypothetical protein
MSNYRDKSVLGSFAKLAADEYLGKSATSLNDSIKKIASTEHLTPFQVEYVAAEANKAVWSKLFAIDKTASYDFPLADAKEIIGGLQVTQTPTEIKNADLDYLSPPVSTKVAAFDPFQALGVQEDAMMKSASARKDIKRQLQVRLEKLAAAKEEIQMQQMIVGTAIDNLETKFIKEARTMILECPFESRGQGMDKIAEFLSACGRPEYGQRLIEKLAGTLKKQGLIKAADLKAPDQYISKDLNARIVNGRHSLYITINTLFDKYDAHNSLGSRYEIVDSSLPVVREKIREL